jgi:uncharacterized repeat protein (TIGR01451 family)
MNTSDTHRIIITTAAFALVVGIMTAVSHRPQTRPSPSSLASYGSLPLAFEPNRGQTDDSVQFLARGPGYSLFLKPDESVMKLTRASVEDAPVQSVALRLRLIGSNPKAVVAGQDELPGKANYFIGNDPSQWRANISTFAKVAMRDVYRGVDLVYYGNQGKLEYDFIVAPGADPSAIRFAVEGADNIRINTSGDLVLTALGHEICWQKPVCYQLSDGMRQSVEGQYVMHESGIVSFDVGPYNHQQDLVIDPVLEYATFIKPTSFVGGDGLQNHGLAIKVDAAGNAYMAGVTESASFPVTGGAFQTTRKGSRDMFVAKLNPAGSALVFATYLGGTGSEIVNGQSCAIATDNNHNVYVTGSTSSTNFPTTVGAYQTALSYNGISYAPDAFVAKLNATGSALLYSTYLGGTGTDYGWSIAVDTNGNAYVCGDTANTGDFPTTAGAFLTNSVNLSGWVTKLTSDGTALDYSTYLSSNDCTYARGIAIDPAGNAYVTGNFYDCSGNEGFVTTVGAFQTVHSGLNDAFVLKLTPDGSALVYSTFLGGNNIDGGSSIAIDNQGNAYVTGTTTSTYFPTTVGAVQSTFQSTPTPQNDSFVAKLNNDGTALVFSTYLGGNAGDDAFAVAIDAGGSTWVTGGTGSTNFPVTVDALQNSLGTAAGAAFVTKLDPSGALAYSTYMRSTNASSFATAYAIATDTNSNAYVTGTASLGILTTPGAFQGNIGFIGGPFVAKFASGSGGSVECSVVPSVATNNINTAHAVTATVTSNNVPVSGLTVNFEVTSGPNAGQIGVDTTDANGHASFSYTGGATTGTDVIAVTGTGIACDATCEWIDSSLFSADLFVSKKANKAQVTINRKLTYTVAVTNNGPDLATGVVVTDTLPLNTVLVAGSTTPGYALSGRTLTFNVGALATGQGTNLVVAIKPKVTGKIVNKVNAAGNETDPNTTNNFAKAKATVVP